MRIVIASDHVYLPDRAGGRESSIHEMALLYQHLGHAVTVVALDTGRGSPAWWRRRLGGARLFSRWRAPYRVLRTKSVAAEVESLVRRRQIDALIVNVDPVARYADSAIHRAFGNQALYLRDMQHIEAVTCTSIPPDVILVANSPHTARRYASRTGRDFLVVQPRISPERYETRSSGEFVTFVNPIPKKGLEVAFGVAAALPDIPFLFVEGWPLPRQARLDLQRRVATLPNVQLWDTLLDMRKVYSRTRVILAPSQWEEAFCRVVVEAQVSGIPAVASHRGGLPDTVGDAGLLVGPDEPVATWAAAVQSVWSDRSLRATLSLRARHMAQAHHVAATSGALQLLERLAA